ncbi:hypothetical protein [Actibacterium sp. 188UL27-1]|uniref:hypothetical protein n=1 Tax=Actibacterium sp. 188UL27-1 TaxID=2786961 RepID=UPI00195B25D0|nr:hypothetical protein [Actibacterium sp. 188UL27-1]MBM7069722.1 hypothetical protein [Actibacterium sp. 188UL27-1]
MVEIGGCDRRRFGPGRVGTKAQIVFDRITKLGGILGKVCMADYIEDDVVFDTNVLNAVQGDAFVVDLMERGVFDELTCCVTIQVSTRAIATQDPFLT